ncbi:flagellar export chaperone FliS [Microbulbifer sp. HZ11]|uniref:flagellar export chaperone FliS n=1 Tax=unclassified Microbulbifer TaxID=2619833 RepID=UPI0005BC9297|nr:flagellar export chaperone FliS [Microbulbifer sp. HZ11]
MYAKRVNNRAQGAASYARVGLESDVLSASPHRLIVLLFQGADTAIGTAMVHLRDGNVAEKGRAISKAIDIVNKGLLAALDFERGGELAQHLASLYEYIAEKLLTANLRNSEEDLNEARRLLGEIASAWNDIDPGTANGK